MKNHLLTEPLLSRKEVADKLGVSVQTVSRIVARGELETVRVGERFKRIPAGSLERYIAEKGGAK